MKYLLIPFALVEDGFYTRDSKNLGDYVEVLSHYTGVQCKRTIFIVASIVYLSKNMRLEILLIDNGSTDSSGEICDTYASEYSNISAIILKTMVSVQLETLVLAKKLKVNLFVL